MGDDHSDVEDEGPEGALAGTAGEDISGGISPSGAGGRMVGDEEGAADGTGAPELRPVDEQARRIGWGRHPGADEERPEEGVDGDG